MTIKSDHWIRRMAAAGMIEPFEPGQVRSLEGRRIVSYGTSSYGYDVRCASEFKIFTNINSTIVDPKAFDTASFVDVAADVCIIPPNSFALARTVELFRIPRNVLVITLGKSTYARCFRGDTRVALVDGTAPTLEEMARRSDSGQAFFGYGIAADGRVIATLLSAPRFIGRDPLLEVRLDNGAVIHATPDHQFLTRDGRMVAAEQLRPGEPLMALNRHRPRGGERTWQALDGGPVPTRRFGAEWNRRQRIDLDASVVRYDRGAINRRGHQLESLERIPARAYPRLRAGGSYGPDFDPAWRSAPIRQSPAGRTRAWRTHCVVPAHGFDRGARPARAVPVGSGRDRTALRGPARGVARASGHNEIDCRVASIRSVPGVHDVYCLTAPEAGNFALEAGVFVRNCGVIVNVTPLEPEWEGHVTLEFSNTTTLPAKIYANEGVAQMLFFESDEVCGTSYKDRAGKYMGQRGVTLPKT